MSAKAYIAIDLKSFFASVECMERGLDPLNTHLVVADESRTDKTICLAVTPSLKSHGIPGRPRLFEVRQKVAEVNSMRRYKARRLVGNSYLHSELQQNPKLELDFIIAPPRMARYMEFCTRIYNVYTKYVSPEHIVVYSIDEVFMDATPYLATYACSAHELARRIILDVLRSTGITATAGIGTNLYLAKVAMDIVAKHIPADADGVRIAELDEMSYRRQLWNHRPLTDFWRVGKGYVRKLEQHGLYTMGDIARRSVQNEESLYRMFGKNAELLIDHAWGWEPCTVEAIKAYHPESKSLGSGQVLHEPYTPEKAKLVLREMADLLVLDLVEKGLVTDQIVITVGYDIENLTDPVRRRQYRGAITTDAYGREIPAHSHGTHNLGRYTSSTKLILQAVNELADRLVDMNLLVRRLNIVANHVLPEDKAPTEAPTEQQLDLFTDYEAEAARKEEEEAQLHKERKMQQALLSIRGKFGKNAILRGMNLEEGATTRDRNSQIGGHKA
ncbi:MAG: hypothetical protein J6R92_02865 [Akkermansia sp.]|nr:hypothetical protein [Akkermansia sp.]